MDNNDKITGDNVIMCKCGLQWSRRCVWDQMMKPYILDTTKLTNDPIKNREIVKDQTNYIQVEHGPVYC